MATSFQDELSPRPSRFRFLALYKYWVLEENRRAMLAVCLEEILKTSFFRSPPIEKILAGMFGCVLSNILFYLQSLLNLFFASVKTGLSPEKLKPQQGCVQYHHEKEHHEKLNQADIKLVMNRLGLEFHEDGSGGDEGFGADELLSLFEEEEPCSMEEVKEVFDVFDENKDGFIDARELNRVMCRLGLQEGIQIEECSRMIRAVGEDRKEKIDFNDFFRFMERCFY